MQAADEFEIGSLISCEQMTDDLHKADVQMWC